MTHSHDPTAPTEWLQRVEDLCGKRGLQLTALRRQITTIMAEGAAPLTAYEIIDELGRIQGRPIGPPTVYRTLDFLTEHGFVVKIESRNAYARCDCPGHRHHGIVMICTGCGRADEVESPALDAALLRAAEDAAFTMRRQMVELEGVCAACRPAADVR